MSVIFIFAYFFHHISYNHFASYLSTTSTFIMTYSEEYNLAREHPYTKALIDSGKFLVDHPYLVNEERKSYSLTAGTLAGTDMIAHTPLTLTRQPEPGTRGYIKEEGSEKPPAQQASYIVFYHLGGRLCGHKDIIHGGLLATLLDEGLCRAGFPLLPNKLGVTGSLNIKYLAPTPAGSLVVLHAWITKLDGRKVTVEGTLSVLGDGDVDVQEVGPITSANADEVYKVKRTVWAEALVIEPRWVAKLQTGHFTPPVEKADSASQEQQPSA